MCLSFYDNIKSAHTSIIKIIMLVRAIKSYSSYEYDIDEDYDYDIKNEYNNQLVEFYKKKKEKKEKVKMKK